MKMRKLHQPGYGGRTATQRGGKSLCGSNLRWVMQECLGIHLDATVSFFMLLQSMAALYSVQQWSCACTFWKVPLSNYSLKSDCPAHLFEMSWFQHTNTNCLCSGTLSSPYSHCSPCHICTQNFVMNPVLAHPAVLSSNQYTDSVESTACKINS